VNLGLLIGTILATVGAKKPLLLKMYTKQHQTRLPEDRYYQLIFQTEIPCVVILLLGYQDRTLTVTIIELALSQPG
jgi:hypothetical protein